jgi:hypothetical protein
MWRAYLIFLCVLPNLALADLPSPVQLTPPHQLSKNLDGLPRIVTPSGTAADRINKALAEADKRAVAAAADCTQNVIASGAQTAADEAKPSNPGDWQRGVSVTMQGPDYLSFLVSDDYFCGGAHPDISIFALVYDLRTGAPVNWLRLIAKSSHITASLDQAADGTNIGYVASPALTDIFTTLSDKDNAGNQSAEDDCDNAIDYADKNFILWPDAKDNAVDVYLPVGFASQPCAGPEEIAMPALKKLGFDPQLLRAIATAHAAGWYQHGQ